MATTSENGSSLAERLLERSSKGSRIGSRKGLFERFGLESPYEGGAVGEATNQVERFSYLSSKAYFDELRGLSAMRRHLLWRISAVRQRIRVGESLRTSVATSAVRAAMLGAWDPTFIDWSTQLDLEEAGVPQDEMGAVAVAASRMRAPQRRQSSAERALRRQIGSASDVLANLESVANASQAPQQREIGEQVERISRLPARRQGAAARRVTRDLKGTAAIAARSTRLDRGASVLGERPLAVAQGRDSFLEPKGLRRVMEDSPIVMTLEQPEQVAPEVQETATVQTATRRPMARRRAQREIPVAAVAREVRTQASTGRAGPPSEELPTRRARPSTSSRPTERIAQAMRLEETTPLTDTRRGLQAALRQPFDAASASHSIERRIAARSEAGLPDEAGRVTHTTGYVHEARPMAMALTDEGKVSRTMSLADAVPVMSPIAHQAGESVGSDVEAAPEAGPRPTVKRTPSARMATHVTPSSRTAPSATHRTPASTTEASTAVRTQTTSTSTSELWRTPATRRSPAHGSRRNVGRALPPMARAVHRSAGAPASESASRVAIAQAPVRSSAHVDRREVGLSRQYAAAVARESRTASPSGLLADARSGAPGAPPAAAEGRALRAGALETGAPEMRVAVPELADTSDVGTDSAQRAVVSTGSSRRSRALPTVRAASRALAQERLGVRGRLLSPSSTAHLQITAADEALSDEPVRAGAATAMARLGETPRSSQREQAVLTDSFTTLVAPPVAESESASAPVAAVDFAPRRAKPTRRPTQASKVDALRIGPVARASERQQAHERVGTTGALVMPRVVAPFVDEAPATKVLARAQQSLSGEVATESRIADRADARAVSRVDSRATDRVQGRVDASGAGLQARADRAPVSRNAEGRAQVGSAPSELTLALPEPSEAGVVEEARSGLVSRAARRAPERETRRSVVPDVTPESARSHDRQMASAVGTSQPVRTESGRVVTSDTHRTQVGATERSIAWRTPRSFVTRTVAVRTPDSETVASEAFRTESSRVERTRAVRTATSRVQRSEAFRTESRAAARGSSAPLGDESFVGASPKGSFLEEVDLEGGVARASRRVDASRNRIGDSALSWLDERRQDVAGVPTSAVGQSSRALGRATVRRDAGSLVPHPVGSEQTDQAATRMLAGPDQVFAEAEGVLLDRDEAIPASTLRTQTRDFTPAERLERPERVSATSGLVDGMSFAAPQAARVEATSVAGGVRAVAPRPGAPSRSRLQRALREAATVGASTRASETVLTLPASQRQLEAGEQGGEPRRLTAHLQLDHEGRVIRGGIEDVLTGARLALPERASSAAWAEERDARATPAPRRARTSRRSDKDEAGTFVPSMRALDVDAAPGAGRTDALWAPLDNTLDSLVSADAPEAASQVERRPLMRRRAWQRRGMAAELGMIAPSLAAAEFSPVPLVPDDAPSWARRAVKGTSAKASERDTVEGDVPGSTVAQAKPADAPSPDTPRYEPSSLMGALARTERPEDLVQVILDRGREAASLRNELPTEAIRIVETISGLGPEEAAFLRSGRRVIQPAALGQAMSGTRASRAHKGAPDLHQLSAAKEGVGANKVMKLADKLMGLIHLAENARGNEAREQVRMAEDSNEARAEGGIQVPGMSVEDMEMNIESLQKNVLNSVMEYFEELDSRREDPDGRNKWW